jgi:hypothetical protein
MHFLFSSLHIAYAADLNFLELIIWVVQQGGFLVTTRVCHFCYALIACATSSISQNKCISPEYEIRNHTHNALTFTSWNGILFMRCFMYTAMSYIRCFSVRLHKMKLNLRSFISPYETTDITGSIAVQFQHIAAGKCLLSHCLATVRGLLIQTHSLSTMALTA